MIDSTAGSDYISSTCNENSSISNIATTVGSIINIISTISSIINVISTVSDIADEAVGTAIRSNSAGSSWCKIYMIKIT